MLEAETRPRDGRHVAMPAEPRIRIHVDPAITGDHAAIVELHGEHDLATAEDVRVAVAPLFGALLVDLTCCTFIDSTIVAILVRTSQALAQDGHSLEIRAPAADSAVGRTLELVQLGAVLPVRPAPVVLPPG